VAASSVPGTDPCRQRRAGDNQASNLSWGIMDIRTQKKALLGHPSARGSNKRGPT
jgi:hypothetical protein